LFTRFIYIYNFLWVYSVNTNCTFNCVLLDINKGKMQWIYAIQQSITPTSGINVTSSWIVLLLFLKMLISTIQKNVYVTYIIYTISICFLIIDKLYYLFLVLPLFGTNLLKLILAEKIDHTGQGSKINYEVQKGVQFRRNVSFKNVFISRV
jgi:hypothetical protein